MADGLGPSEDCEESGRHCLSSSQLLPPGVPVVSEKADGGGIAAAEEADKIAALEETEMSSGGGGVQERGGGRPSRISVTIKDPAVSEARNYFPAEAETIRRGPLHDAIPIMPLSLAVVCCVCNIMLPGIGTIVSAFCVFCCGSTRLNRPLSACAVNLASGLLQLVTFVLILGWIWSIIWGMTFVNLSLSAKRVRKLSLVPYYVRRQSSIDF